MLKVLVFINLLSNLNEFMGLKRFISFEGQIRFLFTKGFRMFGHITFAVRLRLYPSRKNCYIPFSLLLNDETQGIHVGFSRV